MVHAKAESGPRRRGSSLFLGLCIVAATAMVTGCGDKNAHPVELGYGNRGWTQIQFYAPPGAAVTVRACDAARTHQVAEYGPFDNRLEQSPEQFSVFNLAPGRYEFKYTSAPGLPGVSVYGELVIRNANSHEARVFQRRSFVPIALPSEYYQQVEINGDEIFPYRGEGFRTAIDSYDLTRLRTGDVIEKVIVVADLEKAEKCRKDLEQDVAVYERKQEYADARFRNAYLDFQMDVDDPVSNMFGTDKKFIKWEEERREADQELKERQDKLRRTKALLRSDHVLTRKGQLVLATEEVIEPHRDAVKAAEDIGEVLVVMRLGGRHMHWGNPAQEVAAGQP